MEGEDKDIPPDILLYRWTAGHTGLWCEEMGVPEEANKRVTQPWRSQLAMSESVTPPKIAGIPVIFDPLEVMEAFTRGMPSIQSS